MRLLVAVDTVHTAAALCDYLDDRLGVDDEVLAVAVSPADDATGDADAERDGHEALNVVDVRLVLPSVETVERRGDPAAELLALADERSVAEIVVGDRADPTSDTSAAAPDGTDDGDVTTETILASAKRPVVIVPDDAS